VIHSVAHKYTYLLGRLNIDISMNWGVSDLTDKHIITSIMSMEVANQYTDPDTGFKVRVRQFFFHFGDLSIYSFAGHHHIHVILSLR